MNTPFGLEKCFSFINCNLQPGKAPLGAYTEPSRFRAITISRQTGSGGHSVAEKLLEYLQAGNTGGGRPWAIFDRNLVEKVLEDHNLPARLARFMPENRVSDISDTMDELFGLHPPSWELVRKTSETILHLAQLEHVILIGRGSNIITGKLPHVLHVRLVGSMERRIKRLQELNQISAKEAVRMADREDLARRRYVKQFFGKDINDPLLYHLVLNTDLLSVEESARIIVLATEPKSVALAA